MDPLAELRDIHAPGPLEPTLPAPGWWLLGFLAALALAWGLTWLHRRWRAGRYRREALRDLDALLNAWREHGDDARYLTELQSLLKRTALTGFAREEVASLTGEAWVAFLDRSSGTHAFSTGDAEVLIDGNYKRGVSLEAQSLHELASAWIRHHHDKHLPSWRKSAALGQAQGVAA